MMNWLGASLVGQDEVTFMPSDAVEGLDDGFAHQEFPVVVQMDTVRSEVVVIEACDSHVVGESDDILQDFSRLFEGSG